jgi:hypothetical protein
MLASRSGYAVRDRTTGEVAGFVPSSEWATVAEAHADLRNAGYEPLGFSLVRRIVR